MAPPSFTEVLHREVAVLQARHPTLADALSRACAILTEGRLFMEESGREAMVRGSDGTTYYHVNGTCQCPSIMYRNEPCKHRLAYRLYQRVSDALREEEDERWAPTETTTAQQPTAPVLPADAVTVIQGRSYVRFAGLLALAHQQGLLSLETTVVSVNLELAVCQATARFQDGRTFTDIGDADKQNVARHLAPHFVRMAATRAAARALRRALNVGHCAVEELGEEAIS